MRLKVAAALCLGLSAVAIPLAARYATAQTVICFKKKCAEYPDGYKYCELTPVDCSQVQVQ